MNYEHQTKGILLPSLNFCYMNKTISKKKWIKDINRVRGMVLICALVLNILLFISLIVGTVVLVMKVCTLIFG